MRPPQEAPQTAAAPSNPRAVPGHNIAPVSGSVSKYLADEYTAVAVAVEELAQRANEAPKSVTNEEEHAIAAKIASDALARWKHLEAQRTAEKAPYLAAEREVDGFFDALKTRVDRIKKAMTERVDAFLKAKRDAAIAARAEAERLAREEADRQLAAAAAAAEANVPLANAHLEQAAVAEARANQTKESIEQASAADMARTRTEDGVLSTLRTEWKGEIVDYDKLDLEKLRPHLNRKDVEKALRAYVRAGNRELAGARIFASTDTIIR